MRRTCRWETHELTPVKLICHFTVHATPFCFQHSNWTLSKIKSAQAYPPACPECASYAPIKVMPHPQYQVWWGFDCLCYQCPTSSGKILNQILTFTTRTNEVSRQITCCPFTHVYFASPVSIKCSTPGAHSCITIPTLPNRCPYWGGGGAWPW